MPTPPFASLLRSLASRLGLPLRAAFLRSLLPSTGGQGTASLLRRCSVAALRSAELRLATLGVALVGCSALRLAWLGVTALRLAWLGVTALRLALVGVAASCSRRRSYAESRCARLRGRASTIPALLTAFLLALTLFASCTCSSGLACKTDSDCVPGTCAEGLCQAPPPCVPLCLSTQRCETSAFSARCVDITCDPPCAASETCLRSGILARCAPSTQEISGIPDAKARLILPGSYMRGSPDTEEGRNPDEGPQHKVTLTRAFWMMQTEVTQAQYKALLSENPSNRSSCGDTCPVENVTWMMAAAFANALSAKQNLPSCFTCEGQGIDLRCKAASTPTAYLNCKGWRLPTEAEWEYAARAGTTEARYQAIDSLAWYQTNSRSRPHPVAEKGSNAWGLFDILGNVWEWVYDSDHIYPNSPQIDPIAPTEYDVRIQRGGGWNNPPSLVRAASRSRGSQDGANPWIGFRCVQTF